MPGAKTVYVLLETFEQMDPVSAQISQMSDSSDSEEPSVDRVLADKIDLGGRKKKKNSKGSGRREIQTTQSCLESTSRHSITGVI